MTEHGHHSLKWSRRKCIDWVKARRCPKCKMRRLMPGPDYDRFRIACLNCGFRARIKPPEEALR